MSRSGLLDSDALSSFAVFAEHRNFTAAATDLHISQPALHVKIKKLSAELGLPLYERYGRELRLTSYGERLAAFARDSRRRLDDFLAELHRATSPITIAAGRGSVRWVITDQIRRITRDGRVVRVLTANREGALAAVATGRADLGVVAHEPPPRQFESVAIATYPQNLVIAAGHPLAGRESVALSDLDGVPLAMPLPGRPHRRALDRALYDAGVAGRVTAEVDGWDLLVHCAALEIGAAIVNGCVGLPTGVVGIPVDGLPPVRYWAVWRPERQTIISGVLTPVVGAGVPGRLIAASKFLTYVLRHNPSAIGVQLDAGGWIEIDALLHALTEHDRPIDRNLLDRIVAGTDKRRLEIVGDRIRAAQGHSIPVELGLVPAVPPAVLYHGTVERFAGKILIEGLVPGRRTHVHLSSDPETASSVGARRGPPVVLTIDAAGMVRHGLIFYRAANGVWLTSYVPPEWIARIPP